MKSCSGSTGFGRRQFGHDAGDRARETSTRERCVLREGKRAPEPPEVSPATDSDGKRGSDHRGSCFEGGKLAILNVDEVPSGECRLSNLRLPVEIER